MSKVKEKKLIEIIKKKLGKDGIKYVKEHGEIPCIKLTEEEMKFLKGGGLRLIVSPSEPDCGLPPGPVHDDGGCFPNPKIKSSKF